MIVDIVGQQVATELLKEKRDAQPVESLESIYHDWLSSGLEPVEPPKEDDLNEMVIDVFDQFVRDEVNETEDYNSQAARDMDVICGRGRQAYNHPGNRRFRKIVADNYDSYSEATSKLRKSRVVTNILDMVNECGNFVKEEPKTGFYIIVSDRLAREKIGQGLRDILHVKYKSSTKAKTRKRVAKRAVEDAHLHRVVNQNSTVASLVDGVAEQLSNAKTGVPEFMLEQLFLQMNQRILQEFKRSKLVDVLAAGAKNH